MSHDIRLASPRDVTAVCELMDQLGHPIPQDQAATRLAGNDGTSDRIVLLAVGDAGVAGLVAANLLTILADADPVLLITAMVVADGQRGRGLGRQLVSAAEAWGRRRGARRVVVTTALHRAGAHAFYDSLGYQQTGRRYGRDLSQAGTE